jgi:predicted RecB family endonuclease
LFDRYLDRADSGAQELAQTLGVELARFLPVRVVSHHMRLLGVLHRSEEADTLVLVDYDDG